MPVVVSWANHTLAYEKRNRYPTRKALCFLKHVHLVFVTKYRRQIFDHARQKNYALTFQMYVLILKLNG